MESVLYYGFESQQQLSVSGEVGGAEEVACVESDILKLKKNKLRLCTVLGSKERLAVSESL